MAYTPLDSSEIAAGEPTRQEIFQKIKDNEADFDDRITSLEAGGTSAPPVYFEVIGHLDSSVVEDGVMHYRLDRNITALACRVFIPKAGTAGSLQIDVEYKRGTGAWTSILASPITISYTAGSLYAQAGVLAATTFNAGDLFRLNIDAVQTDMKSFSVYIESEAA